MEIRGVLTGGCNFRAHKMDPCEGFRKEGRFKLSRANEAASRAYESVSEATVMASKE